MISKQLSPNAFVPYSALFDISMDETTCVPKSGRCLRCLFAWDHEMSFFFIFRFSVFDILPFAYAKFSFLIEILAFSVFMKLIDFLKNYLIFAHN